MTTDHPNTATIHFLGAAGTVTGSKFLLQVNGKGILVDCGMFQGIKKLRQLNWERLPVNVPAIDAVLLTHGHLDHTGYLPILVKSGFRGKIIGTEPTLSIARIILEDSANIQEEDAEKANKEDHTRHKPAKPLYTVRDVNAACDHFFAQPLDTWFTVADGIQARFRYNGHIIGAAFIELEAAGKRFVFSGDIGRDNDPLLYPPQHPGKADVLLIESTYGGRLHPENAEGLLAGVVAKAHAAGGTIIIPSFAVERTQSLMYLLWKLKKEGRLPDMPVYMDSPMGSHVLDVFIKTAGWHKLSPAECTEMNHGIKSIRHISESYKLAASDHPKIIIAGSGMASGGRVLTYLQHYLGNKNATILLAGYQSEGTRGRQLLDGAAEIKIFGKYYEVKAKIECIEGLSAHADQKGLLAWTKDISNKPSRVFIVHGEPGASDALRVKMKDTYGWDCYIPQLNEIVEIPLE